MHSRHTNDPLTISHSSASRFEQPEQDTLHEIASISALFSSISSETTRLDTAGLPLESSTYTPENPSVSTTSNPSINSEPCMPSTNTPSDGDAVPDLTISSAAIFTSFTFMLFRQPFFLSPKEFRISVPLCPSCSA